MTNVIQVADFPVMIKIKKSSTGKYKSYGCGKDSQFSFKYENNEELDTGCLVQSYADRTANFKTKFYKVLDPEVLEMLEDSDRVTIPTGAYAVNELHKVLSDRTLEFPYISNDNNGITDLAVTSEDGQTTYTFTSKVVNNITTITFDSSVPVGESVKITGNVNISETYKHSIDLGKTVLPNFDVRIEGYKKIHGVKYPFVLDAPSGSKTSEYVIKFLNKNKGSIPEGTELEFNFSTDEVKIIDAISPAEAQL